MTTTLANLVTRIANDNDAQAFQQFYDIYFDRLFAFALQHTGCRELAEEVVSDVFIKIWNGRKSLPAVENVEVYLHVAVKNQSITYANRYSRNRNLMVGLHLEHISSLVDNLSPEKIFLGEESCAVLDEAIQSLPRACKTAFLLVKESGLSYKEAAEVMNVSPHTVKNHLVAAVKKLREHLLQMAANEEKRMGKQRLLQVARLSIFLLFF